MLGRWLGTREVRSLRNSELRGGSAVFLEPSSMPGTQELCPSMDELTGATPICGQTDLDRATESSIKRGFSRGV